MERMLRVIRPFNNQLRNRGGNPAVLGERAIKLFGLADLDLPSLFLKGDIVSSQLNF